MPYILKAEQLETQNNKVSVLDESVTNDQYPSAKAVMDALDGWVKTNNGSDFIVEQGTSDIWSYRKWASGIAECWIADKPIRFPPENITDQTGIEGLKTSFVDVPLPFTFIEFPSSIASCRWKTTEFIECHSSTNSIRFRWYGVETSFDSGIINTLIVSAQVIGRWK